MASKELQMVLEMLKSRPFDVGLSIEEQRSVMEAGAQFPFAEDVSCEKVNAGGVPAEWITTPEASLERVIYYFHGGGYVLGSVNTHREMISRLARAAGAKALAIDYRLAPENPFPAAVEDSVAAYRWLLSSGVKPDRVVIAGDSAGGGLTVATLLALRDAGEPLPAAGVCISPWVDLECKWKSLMPDAEDTGMLVRESVLQMAKAYLGSADPSTPLASPVCAELTGLPPLLIQVGTAGDLFDDATRLAARATDDGVDATLDCWEEMIHVWHMFAAILPEGQQAIERIGEFIRKHAS